MPAPRSVQTATLISNDPNGVVWFDGEYHLFFQYNPFGDTWGHMSWGHAVSRDLVRWKHLPVALAEENGVMIFSGSAVVDHNNTSGLCRNDDPNDKSCLVAIYTGHTETNQSQNIAVSNDRGRTWTKYRGNPVLDIGYKDFRDPKVFWHEPTKTWVMVVALAQERKVRFYGSRNLREWQRLGSEALWGARQLAELERVELQHSPVFGVHASWRHPGRRESGTGAAARRIRPRRLARQRCRVGMPRPVRAAGHRPARQAAMGLDRQRQPRRFHRRFGRPVLRRPIRWQDVYK